MSNFLVYFPILDLSTNILHLNNFKSRKENQIKNILFISVSISIETKVSGWQKLVEKSLSPAHCTVDLCQLSPSARSISEILEQLLRRALKFHFCLHLASTYDAMFSRLFLSFSDRISMRSGDFLWYQYP